MSSRTWPPILARAREIMADYDTSVTLRQLFYRLVSEGVLSNTRSDYCQLSSKTATARRDGVFPNFIDRTREIHRNLSFDSPDDARVWLSALYRRDRTEDQETAIYLGIEKAGIVEQLSAWFGRPLGIPILALGGYASQTYADQVSNDVLGQDRPSVLLYAGDFDPSGEDIDRDFIERTDCFDEVVRVALTPEQIEEYDLPEMPGKTTDTRARGFIEKHGKLVQVEVDALPPDVLRGLFQDAIDDRFDRSVFDLVMEQEQSDMAELDEGAP